MGNPGLPVLSTWSGQALAQLEEPGPVHPGIPFQDQATQARRALPQLFHLTETCPGEPPSSMSAQIWDYVHRDITCRIKGMPLSRKDGIPPLQRHASEIPQGVFLQVGNPGFPFLLRSTPGNGREGSWT